MDWVYFIVIGLGFDIFGAILIVRSLLKNNPLTLKFLKILKQEFYDWFNEQYGVNLFFKLFPKYKKKLKKTFLDESEMKKKLKEYEERYKDPVKFTKFSKSQGRDAFAGIVLLVFGFILQIIGNILQFYTIQ